MTLRMRMHSHDSMGNDLSVKVGDGHTIASRRLADPHAVRSVLGELVTGWSQH